ncbi:MAG: DNA-3-methyladenine glycosylase family protein [Phycisphaerae bacterium]
MAVLHCKLTVKRPFSLKATALSHGWHECAPMNWCEGGACLQMIERIGTDVYRVSIVERARNAKSVALAVGIEGPNTNRAIRDEMRSRITESLKLNHDLSEFHAIVATHDSLHRLVKIGAGRLMHSVSMTENIIKALCATNVNWDQAVKMINRIGQLGPHLPHFRHLNAWPTPREILKGGEIYLRDVCRLGYRVDAILAFCDDVATGKINPESLRPLSRRADVSSDELLSTLRAVRGIGPSSAHFLLTCLGRYDRLSIDSATVDHVRRVHTNGRTPTAKQIERIYAPYGRWKNLVYWFENWLTWETAEQMLAARRIGNVASVNQSADAG